LYTLLAKLASWLPVRSVAWRVNLVSACCHLGAAAFLFLSVRRLSGRTPAAALACAVFAFAPLSWRYATVAEVFALNDLLISLSVYLSVRYATEHDPRIPVLGAFVVGLGLSNHHTIIFVVAPLAVWMLAQKPELRRPRRVVVQTLALCAGLLPHLYLLVADAASPASWGEPASIEGFATHVLRREYGTFRLASAGTQGSFWRALGAFMAYLPAQCLYAGPALALFGAWDLVRRPTPIRGLMRTLLAAWIVYLVGFHALANLPIDDPIFYEVLTRFWLLPLLLKNLGAAYQRLAATDPSARPRMIDAFRRYLEIADPGDPHLGTIRQLVAGASVP
jgi:hypothetical protein